MPETLLFRRPIRFLQFTAGSATGFTGNVGVEAYDYLGNLVDSNNLLTQSVLQSTFVVGHGIAKVEITTTAESVVIDDVQFTEEAPCAHDICGNASMSCRFPVACDPTGPRSNTMCPCGTFNCTAILPLTSM